MTGSGKSYFCNFLLQNAQKYEPLTFIFDIAAASSRLRRYSRARTSMWARKRGTSPSTPSHCLKPKRTCSFSSASFRVLIEGNEQRYRLDFKEERRLWDAIERIYVLEPNQRTVSNLETSLVS